MNVKEYKYLIIGGTTKAATTSLFYYLAEHPEVCAANYKEVRLFLSKDYPLPSKFRFEDGLEKYANFFNHCDDDKLRMEATPDYLHSQGTPLKIRESLPNSKLIFILREPISRLMSWHRFSQQYGLMPKKTSFDEYVELQRRKGETMSGQHLLIMEQGRYSVFLKPYYEHFGRDRIHVVFYEDLAESPEAVLRDVSIFTEIDPDFYANYDFKVHNRTLAMRFPALHKLYWTIRFRVRQHTHDKPAIHGVIRRARLIFEPIYLYFNSRSLNKTGISESTRQMLEDYYRGEVQALEELTGKKVPWEDLGSN
jgi:hypothetical protein